MSEKHGNKGDAKADGILWTREHDGVFHSEQSHVDVHHRPEPVVEVHLLPQRLLFLARTENERKKSITKMVE
jgi:hypothetical protein